MKKRTQKASKAATKNTPPAKSNPKYTEADLKAINALPVTVKDKNRIRLPLHGCSKEQLHARLGILALAAESSTSHDIKNLPQEIEIDAFAELAREAGYEVPKNRGGWFKLLGKAEGMSADLFVKDKLRPRLVLDYLEGQQEEQAKRKAEQQSKQETALAGKGKKKGRENLRSWTQPDLDKAIHQYKADRAPSYADLKDALKHNKKGAKKAAQKIYGRNAIARSLGVKSTSMVSKSPAWMAIAHELGIELKRNRLTGTRHTQHTGIIGIDIAEEQKSQDPADGADNAPPETALELEEREETYRQINRLVVAGNTTKGKADNKSAAEDIIQKLQCEEYSDEQARQIVKTILHTGE